MGTGMGIGMWIFWIVLILIVVFLIKALVGNEPVNNPNNETPLEILRKRYASGEISREQYEQMKKELQ